MEFFGKRLAPLVIHFLGFGVAKLLASTLEPMDLHTVRSGVGAVFLGDIIFPVRNDSAGGAPLARRNERDGADVDRLTIKSHFACKRIPLFATVIRAATPGQ